MASHSSYTTSVPTTSNANYEINDAIPSTSQSSHMAETSSSTSTKHKYIKQFIGHTIPKDFLLKSGLLNSTNGESESSEPLYKVKSDGSVIGIFLDLFDL